MMNRKDDIALTLKEEAGQLPPNSRFHPIRKLMGRFNTSQRTIEQVMEKLVAENVVIRHPGNGYFTRNQSPRRQLHYRLLYPKWPSPSFKRLETQWRNYAEESGKLRFSSRTLDRSDEFFRCFPLDDCDAVLVIPPAGLISQAGMAYLCSLPIPAVVMNHEIGGIGVSMVAGNAPSGGAVAAAHFINNGHRKLAVLVTEPHGDGFDMRLQGFCDFARLSGISVEVIETDTGSWQESHSRCYAALDAHLKNKGLNFTGLFLASAHPALEVYKLFADRGISIPGDVSLVTHDNPPECDFLTPPLDSIHDNRTEQIPIIDRELREVIAGRKSCFHLRLTPKLVVRESVRKIGVSSLEQTVLT